MSSSVDETLSVQETTKEEASREVKLDVVDDDDDEKKMFTINTNPALLEWKNVNYSVHVRPRPFSKKVEKKILQDISGYVAPGQCLAVMGPSGSGKTTLLNLLAGLVSRYEGSITVNGVKRDKSFKSYTAFVQQDDVLMGNLTVRENLEFSAMLRLPSSMSRKEKLARVDSIIAELGLTKCANTKVGITGVVKGISGGERKRCSIGVELITNPSILFLDEPTSGLDAKTSLSIMKTVIDLSKSNRTVICTIHQPRSDIYQLFDKLLLLSRGKVAYFGDASKCVQYFANLGYPCPIHYNPADYFIDLITVTSSGSTDRGKRQMQRDNERIDMLLDAYEKASKAAAAEVEDLKKPANKQQQPQLQRQGQQSDSVPTTEPSNNNDAESTVVTIVAQQAEDQQQQQQQQQQKQQQEQEDLSGTKKKKKNNVATYNSSWFAQFFWVFRRAMMNVIRDKFLTVVRLVQTLAMVLIVSIVFWRIGTTQGDISARAGCLFFILIQNVMNALFSVMKAFPEEKAVFLRERGSKTYRVSSYFLGKTTAELPSIIFFPALFALIIYWTTNMFVAADRFFIFLAAIIMISIVGQALGFAISATFPNENAAMALAPIVITILMLFGGFYVPTDRIPAWISWIRWISPFKYGYEVLIYNEFHGRSFPCDPTKSCYGPELSGDAAMENMGLGGITLWKDFVVMISMFLILRIATYLSLLLLNKRRV